MLRTGLTPALALLTACGDHASQSVALAGAATPAASGVRASATPPIDGVIPWIPRFAATPSPVPTPRMAACRASDVVVSADPPTGFVGFGGAFRLAPRGTVTCGFEQTPGYRYVTSTGERIVVAPLSSPYPPTVPLVSPDGQRATLVTFAWPRHTGDPEWICKTPSARYVAVELRSGQDWLRLEWPTASGFSTCADPVERLQFQVSAPEDLAPRPAPVFDVRMTSPDSAFAGERMRYLVTLTNRTKDFQRFQECPAYIHNIAGPEDLMSAEAPGFRYVEQRLTLNCAGIGDIAAGEARTFEMYFEIPGDVGPGVYILPWRLDGPVYSVGNKVTFRIESRP